MARLRSPVYGVGINDIYDGCSINIKNNQQPKYYTLWKGILKRCYSEKWHDKYPTYINCEIDKDWVYLSMFREWFNENYIEGYHLDKDILHPGNKIYGPNKCIFVPNNINKLLTFRNKCRGKYPLGVSFNLNNGKLNPYHGKCNNGKGKGIIKTFPTIEQAHFWYLEQKITVIDEYLQEDHSDKIKGSLKKWKQLFQYHINNQIIFDPDNII